MKQKPTVTPTDSPVGEYKETHPAYGQISASRCSGSAVLYGSDFVSQHFVSITISKSELNRGLSNDWSHSRDELIEVWLSEAQWATFVSSMNMGSGVQCTLRHIDREQIPQIDRPTNRREQFSKELKENFAEAREAIDELRAEIELAKISQKAKDALCGKLDSVVRSISPNIKFVADQFDEHMEKTVEHAKVEVASYIQAHIQRAGIAVLKSGETILTIGEPPR